MSYGEFDWDDTWVDRKRATLGAMWNSAGGKGEVCSAGSQGRAVILDAGLGRN